MENSNHPVIVFENVTLRVGADLIFEETNWTIRTSQHWHIFGPNGSGKSVLAAAICRKVPVAAGRIRYFFDDPAGPGRTALNPEEIHFISADAGRDLVRRYAGYYQARWHSFEGESAPSVTEVLLGTVPVPGLHQTPLDPVEVERRRKKMTEAVALLKIQDLLTRNIIHLSNGESRKLLLARALMKSPKLLILDNPFVGLDVSSRKNLRDVLEGLIAIGRFQIMVISSREDEILDGITHLMRVEGGSIVSEGRREALMKTGARKQSALQPTFIDPPFPASFPSPSPQPVNRYRILVEMEDTSVTYQGKKVLNGINWRMKPGEHWAVLGHNGAGKTTLLSLILGDNPQAYANRITLFDRKRGTGETIWDIKAKIGFVSPELQLFYHRDITCFQAVCSGFFDSVGLYRNCSREQEDLARSWLHSICIEPLSTRPFTSVSAGEQRLVLIARALVKNPVLLVLDEPCQGLDSRHRRHILTLLDRLCRQTPVSMIFVTHHEDEMPKAITHVLRLSNGVSIR